MSERIGFAGLGIMEAMRSTEPGVFEYQLEAAANFIFKANGARGPGYNAIVGGGKNAVGSRFGRDGIVSGNNDIEISRGQIMKIC